MAPPNWHSSCGAIRLPRLRPKGRRRRFGTGGAPKGASALLRWWTNWRRLTFDQRLNRQHPAQLDGTNNVAVSRAERAIGNWIKERYRTMRTFKRRPSVRNLARLIPELAAHPDQPRLAQLLAR